MQGIWWSENVAACNLNMTLDADVFSFILEIGSVGPRPRLDFFGEKKNILLVMGLKP